MMNETRTVFSGSHTRVEVDDVSGRGVLVALDQIEDVMMWTAHPTIGRVLDSVRSADHVAACEALERDGWSFLDDAEPTMLEDGSRVLALTRF